jgi:hypothetical protein
MLSIDNEQFNLNGFHLLRSHNACAKAFTGGRSLWRRTQRRRIGHREVIHDSYRDRKRFF